MVLKAFSKLTLEDPFLLYFDATVVEDGASSVNNGYGATRYTDAKLKWRKMFGGIGNCLHSIVFCCPAANCLAYGNGAMASAFLQCRKQVPSTQVRSDFQWQFPPNQRID